MAKKLLNSVLWERASRCPTVPTGWKEAAQQRSISLNVRPHRPTWSALRLCAGPWPLDPLPLEASLPPVRRCLLRLRGRHCGRLLLRLIIVRVTETISQHSISLFVRQVFTRLRMKNQYTHLSYERVATWEQAMLCVFYRYGSCFGLYCVGREKKRGTWKSEQFKEAQVHYLECEKLRVNKKLKSPK